MLPGMLPFPITAYKKFPYYPFCDWTATLQQKEWTFDGILSAMGDKDETVKFHNYRL